MQPSKKIILTEDGIKLSSHMYLPDSEPKLNILVAPATGVPQRFYNDFCIFLASHGYKVISFDFRDISESKVGRMKDSKASYLVWALKDFKAVFENSLEERSTLVIGHSFGALSYLLQERANEALGLYGFGTGSGWYGYMTFIESLKVKFLWNVLGPFFLWRYGYIHGKYSGLGSHIPKHVFLEWKKWCQYPNFWFGDPNFKFRNRTLQINRPIKVAIASDDPWTTLKSAQDVYGELKKIKAEFSEVSVGKNKVGHIGYFRKENKNLFWDDVIEWIEGQV